RTIAPSPGTQGDQGAYLRYAREMFQTRYSVVGGRNRMPVYPFLLSLLYRPGLSEAEFLARAQTFNVNLSAALLLLLFAIYRRHFSAFYSLALITGTAFGVFLNRSVFAQTELLFYFISFCMFLSFWRMLVAPTVWLALWSGAIAGIAHLTKASVLPALVAFAIAFALKIVGERRQLSGARSGERWRRPILLALVLASFLLVIFPYIQTSKRVFGRYFYNVNSTFYFWFDSSQEARAFSRTYRDRFGWPNLPPEQIPSASKYWREHSLAQITGRLTHGLVEIATHNARLDGYYKYLFLLGLTATALLAWHWRAFPELWRAHFYPALFLVLFFGAYVLLYAWYVPLSADSRFLLSIFLPFTLAASKLIRRLSPAVISVGGKSVTTATALTAILLFFAAIDAGHTALQLMNESSVRKTNAAATGG
ncbi:MAG: hypothetical protein ABR589_04895, partial [Chthoniobacterales bacterium]